MKNQNSAQHERSPKLIRRWAASFNIFALLFSTSACGTNVVEKYAPANDQEKAELDMEASRYSSASTKLERVLEAEPENHTARSLLGAAYAAQAGITTLGLIKNAASLKSAGSTGISAYTAIYPTVTTDSLGFMGKACDAMAAIPLADRTTEMKLQYSLFFSSYALMQIKYFVDNPAALSELSVEDAAKLILTLAKAGEAGGSSPLTTAATAFAETLQQAPGTSVEKVKTVLLANSQASGG
ncbi:MAG: hypothetical protein EBR09_10585 [Proteobacteria bacterium]|nr:hypothetical protein [Pseudomonadota bacterium]